MGGGGSGLEQPAPSLVVGLWSVSGGYRRVDQHTYTRQWGRLARIYVVDAHRSICGTTESPGLVGETLIEIKPTPRVSCLAFSQSKDRTMSSTASAMRVNLITTRQDDLPLASKSIRRQGCAILLRTSQRDALSDCFAQARPINRKRRVANKSAVVPYLHTYAFRRKRWQNREAG
ncbi:hypothetical protein LX36DRAFT_705188 [Colletotrichum falcatum]|nr:hypothetical protein LX36DRAFT_705188 [Colletotrichum falcatum]